MRIRGKRYDIFGETFIINVCFSLSLFGVIKSAVWFAKRKAFLNGKCQSMFDVYFWHCELKETSLTVRIFINICYVFMTVFNLAFLVLSVMGVL